jgi:hypothetical protein
MTPPGYTDWQTLSDEAQLALSQHAMRRAALIIADQALLFAVQFSSGALQDRGAADALTLFATLLRETSVECLTPVGNA